MTRRITTPFGEPWRMGLPSGKGGQRVDVLDASGAVVLKGVDRSYSERIVSCVNAFTNHQPGHLGPLLAHVDQSAEISVDEDLRSLLDSFNEIRRTNDGR